MLDELCNSMKIGQICHVVGIPAHVHQWPNVTWSIEACSVQTIKPECEASFWFWLDNKTSTCSNRITLHLLTLHSPPSHSHVDPCLISNNFKALHAASACSPWRFPAIVANTFGSSIVPPGLYSTLKLVLLFSLVQTEGENPDAHNHLDILTLTSDTLIIDRYPS